VVFVTAYDQYALQAFNVHAADYLLKPFDRKRLHHALVRVRALAGGDAEAAAARLLNLVAAVRTSRYLERIVIKSASRVYFVRAVDVDRIQASGHYLTLHVGREEHVIRGTIREIAARLHPDRFVRVHRSTIVNLDRIKELFPTFHGEYEIVLRDGTRVTSSRGYSERLQGIVRGTPGTG
jgi:two-component system LytT family response regulator